MYADMKKSKTGSLVVRLENDDIGDVIKLKGNATNYLGPGYNLKHLFEVNIVFKHTS
jgi:hypothetical protein